MSDDAQQRRRRHYAQCTAELIRGPDGGHAALFDQAISNALAAIVAAEQPERLLRKDGEVHAAQQLLDVVTDIGQAEPDGAVSLVPEPVDSEGVVHIDRFLGTTRPTGVRVDVPRLRDAINSTGGTRHGSGGTPLNDDVINALRVLDDHPALCVLDDYLQDGSEQRAVDEDEAERRRAAEYWAALPENELARRRAADLAQTRPSADPHEQLDLHDCPVCGCRELIVERVTDAFGLGYGPGVCLVCSYRRSELLAEWIAIDVVLGWRDDDDRRPRPSA